MNTSAALRQSAVPRAAYSSFGDRNDVLAAIAICREGEALAAALEISQPGARRQNFHLPAGIVDVVLAGDPVAHRLEQIGDARAEGRMPAVSHVQRAGGVGRYEFHQDRSPAAGLRFAVVGPLGEHAADFRVVGVFLEKKIDESGARDFHLGERRTLGQRRHQCLGQLARIAARRLGETHGDIGREIAMLGVARALHVEGDVALGRRQQRLGQFRQCLPQ